MAIMHADPHKQCAITGGYDSLEIHHVLSRAHRGDDARENLVWLRRDFHERITHNDREACALLGAYLWNERPDTIQYLRRKLGDTADDWMRRRLHIEPE